MSSLYTNIPHKDGIASIRQCLGDNNEDPQVINFTCQLLEHIPTKNYFTFNNEKYIQVSRTAMGTRCAPNYAIIFMASLEDKFLAQWTIKPTLWKRHIDDVFMIWDQSEQELETFLYDLNKFHPTIKFTKEMSYKKFHS